MDDTPDAGPRGWAAHSQFSDPGEWAPLLRAAPADVAGLCRAVHASVTHYRGAAGSYPVERITEVDTRWVSGILARLAGRGLRDLSGLPEADRFVGCWRDFSLLFVAALREHGIPARTRIGFADYFAPDFHHDHVVAELWDGGRWRRVDPQLEPGDFGFDTQDMDTGPSGPFRTAAQVWTQYRSRAIGDEAIETFGVGPDVPTRGAWFVAADVVMELAHLHGHGLLLWDVWGAWDRSDLSEVDRLAALLLDPDAHRGELAVAFDDDRYHPRGHVRCLSPTGVERDVDLGA